MKFSEQWLREWVNPDISSHELSEQLSMAGLEVDVATVLRLALAESLAFAKRLATVLAFHKVRVVAPIQVGDLSIASVRVKRLAFLTLTTATFAWV